jgi:hypothetical protein
MFCSVGEHLSFWIVNFPFSFMPCSVCRLWFPWDRKWLFRETTHSGNPCLEQVKTFWTLEELKTVYSWNSIFQTGFNYMFIHNYP